MQPTSGLRRGGGGAFGAQQASFGSEGCRGLEDSWQCGPPRGLRSQLHAASATLAERWKRVDRAFHRGLDLPAVRLYKMGDSYFVEDGNHRVSVARYQGVETMEAAVIEFFPLYGAHQGRTA